MKRCDWIVGKDATQGDESYMLECLRCSAIQKFKPPIPVDYYVSVAKAFSKIHKNCKTAEPEVKE